MIKLKDLLYEGSFKFIKGKYIQFPSGELSSIPGENGRDAIVVQVDKLRDTFYIWKQGSKIYMRGNKQDATFPNPKELLKWLNHNKAKYVGIDDRY